MAAVGPTTRCAGRGADNARDTMNEHGGGLTVETANSHLDDDYAKANADTRAGQYIMLTVTDTGGGVWRRTLPTTARSPWPIWRTCPTRSKSPSPGPWPVKCLRLGATILSRWTGKCRSWMA